MKMKKSMIIPFERITLLSLCLILFACGEKNQSMQNAVKEYAVLTLQPVDRVLDKTYPATIRGRQDIEIRPQVAGFITKLLVDEGSVVKKGQPMFIIDQVQYQAAVNVAESTVNVAKTAVDNASLTYENKKELHQKKIIGDFDLQLAENALATQQAQLAQAKAELVNARKNLSYTTVTSPSDGVVGDIPFREGSLVSSSMTTPLTTVSDVSEMYVYFSMNEKQMLELTRQSDGKMANILDNQPEVSLKLADGTIYPEKGKIETVSGVIGLATGAARMRATFPNPQRILRSGSTGSILVPVKSDSIIVIPQKATTEMQDKKFVFVVNDSSVVNIREIQILPENDGKTYIVSEGLKPFERIVVEGVGISVRDGMKIKPVASTESVDTVATEAAKQ